VGLRLVFLDHLNFLTRLNNARKGKECRSGGLWNFFYLVFFDLLRLHLRLRLRLRLDQETALGRIQRDDRYCMKPGVVSTWWTPEYPDSSCLWYEYSVAWSLGRLGAGQYSSIASVAVQRGGAEGWLVTATRGLADRESLGFDRDPPPLAFLALPRLSDLGQARRRRKGFAKGR
jgi:hypothetical protein